MIMKYKTASRNEGNNRRWSQTRRAKTDKLFNPELPGPRGGGNQPNKVNPINPNFHGSGIISHLRSSVW